MTSSLTAELSRLAEELDKRLESLQADPNPDTIHEVRTLIRRLEAGRRLLPRGLQRKKKVTKFLESAGYLFKATTPVSDLDIAASELKSLRSAHDSAVANALESIQKFRPGKLTPVLQEAKVLGRRRLRKIKRSAIAGSRVAKNRAKAIRKLTARLRELLPAISSDQKALHAFRKDCKSLRYVLEIGRSSKAELGRIERLKQWQDALGEITDIDATLRYVDSSKLKGSLSEVSERLKTLRREKINSLSKIPAV